MRALSEDSQTLQAPWIASALPVLPASGAPANDSASATAKQAVPAEPQAGDGGALFNPYAQTGVAVAAVTEPLPQTATGDIALPVFVTIVGVWALVLLVRKVLA